MEVQVMFADLPARIKGMTVKTFDEEGGDDCYTIVLNSRLNAEQQRAAYYHEMMHLNAGDFDDTDRDVDQIEMVRHVAI